VTRAAVSAFGIPERDNMNRDTAYRTVVTGGNGSKAEVRPPPGETRD